MSNNEVKIILVENENISVFITQNNKVLSFFHDVIRIKEDEEEEFLRYYSKLNPPVYRGDYFDSNNHEKFFLDLDSPDYFLIKLSDPTKENVEKYLQENKI